MRRHRVSARALFILVLATSLAPLSIATAGGLDHELTAEDAAGFVGDFVDVVVSYDNSTAEGVRGWSYGVAHDSSDVTLIDAVGGSALDSLNGGAGPDFKAIDLLSGGWTSGVVVSFTLADELDPGLDYELDIATYEIDGMIGGETTSIDFVSTLGVAVPVDVCFVFDTLCELPDLVSGTITALVIPTTGIVRGDINNDGSTDADDVSALCNIQWPDAPPEIGCVDQGPPLDCVGDPDTDSADINDNEFLTVADYIMLRTANVGSATIPAPTGVCGDDPDNDMRGFGTIDTDYTITIGDLILIGTDPSLERTVFFPFVVDSPTDSILGFTAILEFDSSVLSIPPDPQDAFVGLGEGVVVSPDPSTLVISRWNATPGDPLIGSDVGVLQLTLAPFAVFAPLEWIAEITVHSGAPEEFTYRATVVDDAFDDHHPELLVGEFEFARGNSNSDSAVNIADSIFTLDYLFSDGPVPNCFDAADANNDSGIDIADPIYTLAYLFSDGPIFPAPFPQCGLDSGPIDLLGCNEALPGDACFE